MANTLPVSRLIQVSVALTPAAAQSQNLSTLLVLGSSAVIDATERYRDYSSITAVAADFGTVAAEYQAALLWFQQAPQPTKLRIGRWLQTASSGVLRGAPLSLAQQALANFTAVVSGGFTYSKNGAGPTNVTALNLGSATNLNMVASLITAALSGATMIWNAIYQRFELTSATTGGTSSISFLTAPGSGTDISALLGMLSSSSGAYTAPGAASETAIACLTTFDQNFGQSWYAAVILGAANADHLACAAFLEATVNKHVYGVSTQEAATLVIGATTDIAYQLAQLGYNKTFSQFSSSNPYSVVSLLGRQLTVDYTQNNSVITVAFKNEPGIVAEAISSPQADSLQAKKCNAFLAFDNSTAIILNGVAASGVYIDVVTGTDWLASALMTAMYNALYTTTTKIPQTDAGMNLLVTVAESICAQAVANGLVAPGVWTSGGFGILKQNDYMPKGFYIYAPPVALQNPSDRAARKSVPIQIAVKLAGAVHDIVLAVSVNQ